MEFLLFTLFVYGRVTLIFTPSFDHATVSYYEISVVRALDGEILSTVNIGKPKLRDTGDIQVRLVIRNIPLGLDCYFVARAIRGIETSGYSDPSATWQRIRR